MVKLTDYRKPAFTVDAVDLDFALDPDRTIVRSRLAMRRLGSGGEALSLDGRELELLSIKLDGRPLDATEYELTPETLVVRSAPAQFTIEIETAISPATNTALEGLYMSGGRFCTQCEAESFRRITYYLDRPDVLSRFTVRMSADRAHYPTLLSNGDRIEGGDLEGGRHYAIYRDPHLKPAYLFALVAGEFDTIEDRFDTASGKPVRLFIHVDRGDAARAQFGMEALKSAMRWDEERFKREYDLGEFHIVAVRDFNYGAMENKGLNIFNSSLLLADVETATDADYAGVLRVIGHEYFHNWTGNRITLRDWFQLCLKEGLTVYRDQEFTSDLGSRPVQRIMDVMRLREEQLPEDMGPLAHAPRPAEYQKIDNFYTATVYRKGAEVVRVLSALVGREAFDKGMQLYFERCDGMAATLEDFVACFEEASGRELGGFFGWYEQAGTPTLSVEAEFDEEAQRLILAARQTTPPTPGEPQKKPVPIPLRVGFIDDKGEPLSARLEGENLDREEHDIVLEQAEQRFTFEGVARRPIPAVLRGYQAPVTLSQKISSEDRLVQMAYDVDPFTRWEAGRTLMIEAVLAHAASGGDIACTGLVDALRKELARRSEDAAFAALALEAPSLNQLIHARSPANPEALYRSREALLAAVARELEEDLVVIASGEEPQAEDVGHSGRAARALRGSAFALLARRGARHEPLLFNVFTAARGMTEKMNALRALSVIDGEAYQEALRLFLDAHRRQPLAVDKWFAVQAASPAYDAEKRVRTLARHELFTLTNPNRVRSLYATFGQSNLRAFNAPDGSGYRLVAEAIEAVDQKNPMVAARLARVFEAAPLMEQGRWKLAANVIQSMLDARTLSPNVAEILGKIVEYRAAA